LFLDVRQPRGVIKKGVCGGEEGFFFFFGGGGVVAHALDLMVP